MNKTQHKVFDQARHPNLNKAMKFGQFWLDLPCKHHCHESALRKISNESLTLEQSDAHKMRVGV